MTTRCLRDTDDRLEQFPLDEYEVVWMTAGPQPYAEFYQSRHYPDSILVYQMKPGAWFVMKRRLDVDGE